MVEITKIEENLDRVRLPGKQIYLIGTAHISKSSVELAERIIAEIKPDTVAIELCEGRFQSLKNPERWKNMDIVAVLRAGKAYVLMAQLALVAFQKKLGDKLNIKPGAEMMAAVTAAEQAKATLVLADRDVTLTLKRTWAAMGLWSIIKVFGSLLEGLFSGKSVDEAEIERLKSSDALDELMKDFSKTLPEVRRTLIDERDQYLAAKIQSAPGETVVAVVGAGHVPGIKNWIGQSIDLAPLETLPEPRWFLRTLSWLIPTLVVGLIVYGFFAAGAKVSLEMISAWIWITGSFAALGAILSLGHPLTIVSAFLASPLTTLHPFLASGWIAGLVEAWIRKPRVSDLETIAEDLLTVRGIWKNRVSRILLIMALTNLTGTIGALWGIKVVASML